jgi:diketogulonate reductase-like aldo/keto reductase
VAINWVRQKEGVMIPIVGARKLSQMEDSLKSLDYRLEENHMQRLDEISRIEMGFPHEFLKREHIKNVVYGGTFDSIDSRRG